MTETTAPNRRSFLARGAALLGTLALAGCTDLSQQPWVLGILGEVENLTRRAQRLFAGGHALAPEYAKADIAPVFRANGTLNPNTSDYSAHVASGFKDWTHRGRRAGRQTAETLDGPSSRHAVAHPDHPA